MKPRNFRKLFVTILAAALLTASCISCGGSPAKFPERESLDKTALIKHMTDSTVILLDNNGDQGVGDAGVCTATRISETEILTAFHCIVAAAFDSKEYAAFSILAKSGAYDMTGHRVDFANYDDVLVDVSPDILVLKARRSAIVDRVDPRSDLAILRTKDKAKTWASVAGTDLEMGEVVFGMTHTGMFIYSYSTAYVAKPTRQMLSKTSQYNPLDTTRMLITQIDSGLWKGSSGSAVFTADGRIAGVMSMLGYGQSGLSICIHRAEIAKLVAAKK